VTVGACERRRGGHPAYVRPQFVGALTVGWVPDECEPHLGHEVYQRKKADRSGRFSEGSVLGRRIELISAPLATDRASRRSACRRQTVSPVQTVVSHSAPAMSRSDGVSRLKFRRSRQTKKANEPPRRSLLRNRCLSARRPPSRLLSDSGLRPDIQECIPDDHDFPTTCSAEPLDGLGDALDPFGGVVIESSLKEIGDGRWASAGSTCVRSSRWIATVRSVSSSSGVGWFRL